MNPHWSSLPCSNKAVLTCLTAWTVTVPASIHVVINEPMQERGRSERRRAASLTRRLLIAKRFPEPRVGWSVAQTAHGMALRIGGEHIPPNLRGLQLYHYMINHPGLSAASNTFRDLPIRTIPPGKNVVLLQRECAVCTPDKVGTRLNLTNVLYNCRIAIRTTH